MKSHSDALQKYSQQLTDLAANLSEDNLKVIHAISGDIKAIVSCVYMQHYFQPPMKVSSKDFKADPGKWVDLKQGFHVMRKGKCILSCGYPSALSGDASGCSVCHS